MKEEEGETKNDSPERKKKKDQMREVNVKIRSWEMDRINDSKGKRVQWKKVNCIHHISAEIGY